MAKRNIISLIRSMMDSGASVEEIVSSLREMGIPEGDARRLIILANREMLLTLRNDLREIVRSVLDEEKESMFVSIRRDLKNYLDAQVRLTNRNLLKFLRDEMGKYLSELSRLEDKVDVLDKRVLDLERKVLGREVVALHGGRRVARYAMLLVGVAILVTSLLIPLDMLGRVAMGIVAIGLIVGGAVLG